MADFACGCRDGIEANGRPTKTLCDEHWYLVTGLMVAKALYEKAAPKAPDERSEEAF